MNYLTNFRSILFLLAALGSLNACSSSPNEMPVQATSAKPIKEPENSTAAYEQGCNDNIAEACFRLGQAYTKGEGVAQDLAKAATLFELSCNADNAKGCDYLGQAYWYGKGVKQDAYTAVPLFKRSCDAGEASACYSLGFAHANGKGILLDLTQAATLFKQSCQAGYMQGCAGLGRAYATGEGVAQDPKHAASFYKQSCDGGYPYGCHNLGLLYEQGAGVAQDLTKAAQLFQQACTAGYAQACSKSNKGIVSESIVINFTTNNGEKGKATFEERTKQPSGPKSVTVEFGGNDKIYDFNELDEECREGSPRFCFDLGTAYYTSAEIFTVLVNNRNSPSNIYSSASAYFGNPAERVAEYLEKAATAFNRSCDLGNAQGCFDLGSMYNNGQGVTQDSRKAVQLFDQACEAGSVEACNQIKGTSKL